MGLPFYIFKFGLTSAKLSQHTSTMNTNLRGFT